MSEVTGNLEFVAQRTRLVLPIYSLNRGRNTAPRRRIEFAIQIKQYIHTVCTSVRESGKLRKFHIEEDDCHEITITIRKLLLLAC